MEYRSAIERIAGMLERLVLVAEEASDAMANTEAKINPPAPSAGNARSGQALSAQEPRGQGRGILVGFLVTRHVSSQWELENIVVADWVRRQGIGAALLRALLERVRQENGYQILLEVRESNAAARALYKKTGFCETGRRKMYYSDPPEDAILYTQNVV